MSAGATSTTLVIGKLCWVAIADVPRDVKKNKEKSIVATALVEE